MPVLRKKTPAGGLIVQDDRPGESVEFGLSSEGERFLTGILALSPGDEVREKDLMFLLDRGWAKAEPAPPPVAVAPPPLPKPEPPAEPKRSESHRGPATRRTRAREIALQVLYQMEQNSGADAEEIERFIVRRLRDERLQEFARALVAGVKAHQPGLDTLISGVAENWRIDRMAAIDRNILRLGAFEMLYDPDVPVKVAINEALELAKRYSTAQSSRFVNGILDRLHSNDSAPPAPAEPATPETEAAAPPPSE